MIRRRLEKGLQYRKLMSMPLNLREIFLVDSRAFYDEESIPIVYSRK
jgi:hypothetical protein